MYGQPTCRAAAATMAARARVVSPRPLNTGACETATGTAGGAGAHDGAPDHQLAPRLEWDDAAGRRVDGLAQHRQPGDCRRALVGGLPGRRGGGCDTAAVDRGRGHGTAEERDALAACP